jgi:hypothetical protein
VVEQEFPDWNELVFSDPFQAWKDQLPPAMRSAWDHASTGQDALAFLRMYRQQTEGAAAPTPTPSPSPAPQVQAQAKRDKLSQAVGVPSRPAVAQTGMPAADDFDANFAFFAAQQRRGS